MMFGLTPSPSHARTFLIGALAGGLLFAGGLMLGGAGQSQRGRGGTPDGHFATLQAERIDIVNRRGDVVMRLRADRQNGGNLRVFDRSGDARAELRADGSVRTYGGNERLRALLGRDPDGRSDRRGGVLKLLDPSGRVVSSLPGRQRGHRSHDHDHDFDGHYEDEYRYHTPHDRPLQRPRWREDE